MKIINEFTVKLARRRSIRELVQSGNYGHVNFLVRQGVTKNRFTLQEEVPGDRQIVILGSDDEVGSNDVLTAARKMGLVRPSMVDAFLIGEQNPEQQTKGPILFLHDPQYIWSGHVFYMMLDYNKKGRGVTFISSGGIWDRKFRFAFRRKT